MTSSPKRVPELSQQVENLIKEERRKNPSLLRVFDDFYALCRQAINPNLSEEAVERMLVQHLLTERIFRKIFNNPDFSHRNVVAAEIEKVIAELTKRSLNRDEFLKRLEPFYHAIERNAENATDYSEKQDFLNTVYMRFFQGFSPKEADTHGIVYTPQPIVNFMVRSVEEILQKEFGRSLSDKGVHILDPFVGTGNFITRIMQDIKTTALPYKYENELHCNEVMLLPYYIASMNIEHAYFERTGEYRAFQGICLVDTFELAEAEQASLGFMTEENAQRVKRQKESPIFVVIGNPPYNANQQNEDDNNKNRKYRVVDRRIAETYAKDSEASNRNSLLDPYVKAIRWASDRIGEHGVVAFITNRSFADAKAFDAVRKHLAMDFSLIYHLNLKGDARTTGEMRRQQAGNVFDDAIRVGVGVTILVRRATPRKTTAEIHVAEVDDYLTSEQKRLYLENANRFSATELRRATIDLRGYWQLGAGNDFESHVPLGDRTTKGEESTQAVFEAFGGGVKTNRDAWAYNMDSDALAENMRRTIDFYNDQVSRWLRTKPRPHVDDFVTYDEMKISWSRDLKQDLERGRFAEFSPLKIRKSVYRPFTASNLFLDRVMNEEVYLIPSMFPTELTESENRALALTIDPQIEFSAQTVACIPCIHVGGRPSQVFPFYTYAEDGTHRRENITDWALEQFRSHYADPSITKWDIFHYVYAVLHHPEYRERYAANLRRELPRIPFVSGAATLNICHSEPTKVGEGSAVAGGGNAAGKQQIPPSGRNDKAGKSLVPSVVKDVDVFRALAKAGQRLAEIHVHYEQQPEYPLTKVEKAGEKLDYRVEKMKLSKDKTSLIYNQFLTLSGIPPETYEYRLGNRSALDWIIDQYQVSTDKRSGITNDPNREDDPQYILRLIGQVISVSLETVKIVRGLPFLGLPQ